MNQEKYVGSHTINIKLKADQESEHVYCDLVILVKCKSIAAVVKDLQILKVGDNATDCEKEFPRLLLQSDTKCENEKDENEVGDAKDHAEEEIKVHRVVLGTISPYFHTMLTTEMKEKYEKIVDLTHFGAGAVKLVIGFIYEGEIVITQDNVNDVLHVADYMHLKELKGFCERFLKSIANSWNCLSFFDLSQIYNLPMLCQKAQWFMCKNLCNLSGDFKSAFLKFTYEQILGLLICPHDKMCLSVFYKACIEWIKYDLVERTPYLHNIMSEIDFKKLKLTYLSQVVSKEDIIRKSLPCQQLLLHAYDFHTNPETIQKETRREKLESIVKKEAAETNGGLYTSWPGSGYFKLDKSWHEKWKNYTTNNGHGWHSEMTREEWHCFTPPGPIDNSLLLGKSSFKPCSYVNQSSWDRLVARHGIISTDHAIKT